MMDSISSLPSHSQNGEPRPKPKSVLKKEKKADEKIKRKVSWDEHPSQSRLKALEAPQSELKVVVNPLCNPKAKKAALKSLNNKKKRTAKEKLKPEEAALQIREVSRLNGHIKNEEAYRYMGRADEISQLRQLAEKAVKPDVLKKLLDGNEKNLLMTLRNVLENQSMSIEELVAERRALRNKYISVYADKSLDFKKKIDDCLEEYEKYIQKEFEDYLEKCSKSLRITSERRFPFNESVKKHLDHINLPNIRVTDDFDEEINMLIVETKTFHIGFQAMLERAFTYLKNAEKGELSVITRHDKDNVTLSVIFNGTPWGPDGQEKLKNSFPVDYIFEELFKGKFKFSSKFSKKDDVMTGKHKMKVVLPKSNTELFAPLNHQSSPAS